MDPKILAVRNLQAKEKLAEDVSALHSKFDEVMAQRGNASDLVAGESARPEMPDHGPTLEVISQKLDQILELLTAPKKGK